MYWKILGKILKRHVWLHLLIPLMVGLLIEAAFALFSQPQPTWDIVANWRYLTTDWAGKQIWKPEKLVFLGGIVLTYLLIMFFLVKKETSSKVRNLDHRILNDSLQNAVSFYGTSLVSMEGWFDPAAQMYLANIVNQRSGTGQFKHERVLLFFAEKEVESLAVPVLDGYYGSCLAYIHRHYGIECAFLRPEEILNLLRSLTPQDRQLIGCPAYLAWLCDHISPKICRCAMRRIRGLDFSLIERKDPATKAVTKRVLRMREHLTHVGVEAIDEPSSVEAFERVVTAIKERTHTNGAVNAAHDFLTLFPGL